jgi:hypothetical protein
MEDPARALLIVRFGRLFVRISSLLVRATSLGLVRADPLTTLRAEPERRPMRTMPVRVSVTATFAPTSVRGFAPTSIRRQAIRTNERQVRTWSEPQPVRNLAIVAPRCDSGASQNASTSGCFSSAACTMPRWTPLPRP